MGPALLLGSSSIVGFLQQGTPLRAVNQKRESSFRDSASLINLKPKKSICKVSFSIWTINMLAQNKSICTLLANCVCAEAAGGEITLDENITNVEDGNVTEQLEPEEASSHGELVATVSSEAVQLPKQKISLRRSRKITLKNEDLISGAIFTGKVTAIQPFGAFVDFGAFTNGLIHISRLSSSYVKAVEDVVKIGQEVSVQVLEVNVDARRISLILKDNNASEKVVTGEGDGQKEHLEQKGRQISLKKTSNLQKGQSLTGVVKNKVRSGVFVSLPDGEEGFLPTTEMNMGQKLQTGQEVNVRVLQKDRGRIGLTMKKKVDLKALNEAINKDSSEGATNPFKLAFMKNEVIASYLEEKQRLEKEAEKESTQEKDEMDGASLIEGSSTENEKPSKQDGSAISAKQVIEKGKTDAEQQMGDGPEFDDKAKVFRDMQSDIGKLVEAESVRANKPATGDLGKEQVGLMHDVLKQETLQAPATNEEPCPNSIESQAVSNDSALQDDSSKQVSLQGHLVETVAGEFTPEVKAGEADSLEKTGSESVVTENIDLFTKATVENVNAVNAPDQTYSTKAVPTEKFDLPTEVPVKDVVAAETFDTADSQRELSADVLAIGNAAEKKVTIEECQVDTETAIPDYQELDPEPNAFPQIEAVMENEIAASEVSDETSSVSVIAGSEAASLLTLQEGEAASVLPNFSNANKYEEKPTGVISASLVKQLREETGAGLMDCKNALVAAAGDLRKAQELLRKKGLAGAEKKSNRIASEGIIGSYIHDNRIGVMIEVNCETDFVARSDIFKMLVEDLAMQVAACPQVQCVSMDDVSPEMLRKERELEMQREDILMKPEQIRQKIVDGRIAKRAGELSLLEQPYIKDDKVLVKDHVKQTIATLGENILVRRFLRYNLGEGLEKRDQDFAAEIAAQTKVKQPSL